MEKLVIQSEKRSLDAMQATSIEQSETSEAKRVRTEDDTLKIGLQEAQKKAVRASFIKLFTAQIIPLPIACSPIMTLHGSMGWSKWLKDDQNFIDYTPVMDILKLDTVERCDLLVKVLNSDSIEMATVFLAGIEWAKGRVDEYRFIPRKTLRTLLLLAWTLMFAKHSGVHHYGSYELQVLVHTLTIQGPSINVGDLFAVFLCSSGAMAKKYTVSSSRIYQVVLTYLSKRLAAIEVAWETAPLPEGVITAAMEGNIDPMEKEVPQMRVRDVVSFTTSYHSFAQEGTVDLDAISSVVKKQKNLII